jgi:hypothetical protein
MSNSSCQFCSQISAQNGERLIGTAGYHDRWLVVERPLPWSAGILADPELQSIVSLLKQIIFHRQIALRALFIAPDREYSIPGFTRIIYYNRAARYITAFTKTEYLIPDEIAIETIVKLLTHIQDDTHSIAELAQFEQTDSNTRDLLVCTHANVDLACGRFGTPIYTTLRRKFTTDRSPQLRVWRCSHFGGHQFAPTLIDLPSGRYWGRLTTDNLASLVDLAGDLDRLLQSYRGWSALPKFAQILEKELWLQTGWDWLAIPKTAEIVATDGQIWRQSLQKLTATFPILALATQRWQMPVKWADVRVTTDRLQHYNGRIELQGTVQTALKSGTQIELHALPQYQLR